MPAAELLLVRQGHALHASDPISAEAIAGLEHGKQYRATLSNPRNPAHHRLVMGLLAMCWENQTERVFATQEHLLAAVKVDTGLRHTVTSFTGLPFIMPDSVSWSAMSQDRFGKWWNEKVITLVTESILPGMQENDLKREIEAMLEQYG